MSGDQRLALAERVSTALWVDSDVASAGLFADEVRRDAEERAAAVQSSEVATKSVLVTVSNRKLTVEGVPGSSEL